MTQRVPIKFRLHTDLTQLDQTHIQKALFRFLSALPKSQSPNMFELGLSSRILPLVKQQGRQWENFTIDHLEGDHKAAASFLKCIRDNVQLLNSWWQSVTQFLFFEDLDLINSIKLNEDEKKVHSKLGRPKRRRIALKPIESKKPSRKTKQQIGEENKTSLKKKDKNENIKKLGDLQKPAKIISKSKPTKLSSKEQKSGLLTPILRKQTKTLQ